MTIDDCENKSTCPVQCAATCEDLGYNAPTPVKHAAQARYDVKQPVLRDSRSASAARALSLPQSPSPVLETSLEPCPQTLEFQISTAFQNFYISF